MASPLTILSISDIHLGNGRVDTYSITERFRDVVFPRLAKTKLLVLGGDITDTTFGFGDISAKLTIELFIDLFKLCDEYGISVVLLRGTISHDRDHLKTLCALHASSKFKCPLYYVDTLSVGEIPEYGLKVGYIPDNLPQKDATDAVGVLKEQMAQRGWKTLDYVFAHGYFQHVLPKGLPREPHCTFRAEQFDFVTRYVVVGHVHTPSQHKNVLYNGSFDRLAHGEEEDKGFLYITDTGKDARIEFVKNPYATPFLTFDLSAHLAVDDATQAFQTRIDKLELTIIHHIRVFHPELEVRQGLGKYVAKTYPNIRYSHIGPKSASSSGTLEKTPILAAELIMPTVEGLPDMIKTYLMTNGTPLDHSRILHHLNKYAP